MIFCFFFSSRRRHTRSLRDWSSDVCSSDLGGGRRALLHEAPDGALVRHAGADVALAQVAPEGHAHALLLDLGRRSEERRVGKECRSRWSAGQSTKKNQMTEAVCTE